ncbi:PD-(D/E)XK nuclease family protein [Flagellimonas allohymeniacidonis]|uniref:PD-(D/E)XK nuclease family protein n=2 Tax=Flagellimonas allohymeniacidonis TaxID=2517819 RepID=A0A4Q8QHS8_9FLAO|nr:PD-(D/E)XK nuclease family protein [Allomuricauda hymeniacidonis]
MDQSFLEHVLDDLKENGYAIESCTYILPSKRSGFFLKQHLSKRLDRTVFAPRILSIEEFVEEIAGVKNTSSLELIIELYKAYLAVTPKEPDDFDSFLKWGQTLLQDFNEIDRYLIPPEDILNYLAAIKEIDHWSLKKDKTDLVKNYLSLWQGLHNLYEEYTSQLLDQNIGYQGLVYKKAAQNITKYTQNTINSTLVFVGFNALNTAESDIIQHLLGNCSCEIYWDMDTYFLEDSIHDAGLFIRNYLKDWPYYRSNKPKGLHSSFVLNKDIQITGVPKSIAQAKFVGNILEDLNKGNTLNIDKTALVLADETLLTPILHALPQAVPKVNITMGMALQNTLLYSFIQSYFELLESKSDRGWFHKSVLKFLSNPYCQKISASLDIDFVQEITSVVHAHNIIHITETQTSQYFNSEELFQALFPSEKYASALIVQHLHFLIDHLKSIFQKEKDALELEYLYRFHLVFNQLKNHLESVSFITDIKSLKSFFKALATSEQIDFIGEPLSGLQIMGMLESRNLDFETVILTSVNEGILPTGKSNNSFIPYDVKREYGLPTFKEKDAIYTYHFYRLIQRAKTVHLIYNTEPDVLEGGEKSRLISQLMTDETIAPFVTHTVASPRLVVVSEKPKQIAKTPRLLSDLENLARKGFSPTSLTNYIRNPLDFYKQNVLRLDDASMVEENIAANTFGTILHDTLHALYEPLIGKTLSEGDIKELKPKINGVVQSFFQKHLPGADVSRGRFLLVLRVVEKYIGSFLNLELQELKNHTIKILALEERYETILDVSELKFPIKIKGFIDRIDEYDGLVRIVDYKTGVTQASDVKFKEGEELFSNANKNKAFQLMCYSYLYSKNQSQQSLKAGIYAIKNLKNGFLNLTQNRLTIIDQQALLDFEMRLKQLILEIFNPDIPLIEKEV